jgi:hypothetical protein
MKSKKTFIAGLLLILVLVNMLSFYIPLAYAEGENDNLTTPPTRMEIDQNLGQEEKQGEKEVDNKYKGQSILERIIASLFTSLATSIYEILGIKDPLMLIFDYEPAFDLRDDHVSREELYLGIYNQSEMNVITALYETFEAYLPLWLFVAIVLTGLLIVFAGFGGDPRLTAKQYISGILLACVLLAFGPNLIKMVFDFIYAGVDIVKNLIEQTAAERGIELPKSLLAVLLAGFMRGDSDVPALISDFSLITGLMYAIIIFLIFIGAGVLNWQYIVRKITLAVLIFMFPFVAGMAVFPNTRGALKVWFSEFFASAFLVLAHAIVYGFIIMISMSPERSFSPLEIIIFIVGLNGTIGLVRGMFGAHQGRGGILGGMGTLLGLSSLTGLGKMAFGMKGGIGGIGAQLASNASEAAKHVPTMATAANDINKIADAGNNLSPEQVALMSGQMNGSLTDEQKMELDGPKKDLSIDNQLQSIADSKKGGQIGLGKALAFGTVGALVGGMVTGNATAGITPGIYIGGGLTSGAINAVKNTGKAIRNPNSMGIYSVGQLFDSKSAKAIGRNIAGKPGAVAGWAVSKAASAVVWKNPFSFRAGPVDARNPQTRFADQVRTDIQNQYEAAQKEYLVSQQKMQIAQYELQQVESEYLEVDKPNNFIYEAKKFYAENKLAEAKKEFHESQIRLKEAEIRKQHEDDYVGIRMKMESIRRPEMQSSGGIN